MSSLGGKVDKFIEFLEKDRLSLFGIFLWILFISILRGYLESVLHYGSFSFGLFTNDVFTGISSFVGACLIISYFSGAGYKKTMNIAALGWIIFISPPLFDFFVFGTLETGSWSYIDVENFNSPLDLFFPFFVAKSKFSTGLIFQTIAVYAFVSLYILWRSRSIKNLILFLPFGFFVGFLHGLPSFFFFMINEAVLELKLLPAAYQWYFSLFVLWSGLILLVKNKFRKDFMPFFRNPLFLGIGICFLGGLLSFPRFLNSFDLLLRICVSVFLLTSLRIYIKNKTPPGNMKTFISSIFFNRPKKAREFRVLEIAFSLQIISIVIAFCNSYLNVNPAFIILTIIAILIINIQEFLKTLIKNRKLLYSFLVPLCFAVGYSVTYGEIFDVLRGTWFYIAIIFLISVATVRFSRK